MRLLAAMMVVTLGCGDNLGAPRDAGDHDALAGDGAAADARPACATDPDGPLRRTDDDAPVTGDPNGLDLRCRIAGGLPPYQCHLGLGPGAGTVPAGLDTSQDPSGCLLVGGPDPLAGDLPGYYGFIASVEDADGAAVDIPVGYSGDHCSAGPVSVSPDPASSNTIEAGATQTWTVAVSDIDGVDNGEVCLPCFALSLLTRAPLDVSQGQDCGEPGAICSDCDDCFTGSCPGTYVMSRDIELRAHDPVRPEVGGWVTVEATATYSGDSLDPCGTKRFACHIEVLEQ